MRKNRISRLAGWFALAALLALLLAACGAENSTPPPPTEPPADSVNDNAADNVDASPVEANSDGTIPMPELGFSHGDPDLKASLPKSFIKAAGKPQLVEMFAFW